MFILYLNYIHNYLETIERYNKQVDSNMLWYRCALFENRRHLYLRPHPRPATRCFLKQCFIHYVYCDV